MRKRVLAVILSLAMAFSLSGFSGGSTVYAEPEEGGEEEEDPVYYTGKEEEFKVIAGETVELKVIPGEDLDQLGRVANSESYTWYKEETYYDEYGEEYSEWTELSAANKNTYLVDTSKMPQEGFSYRCDVTVKVDGGDEYYYSTFQVFFEIDSYHPVYINTETMQGELGKEVTLTCDVVEVDDDWDNKDEYEITASGIKYAWMKLNEDDEYDYVDGGTSRTLDCVVKEEPQTYVCKVTIPVKKGSQNLTYDTTSGDFTVMLESPFYVYALYDEEEGITDYSRKYEEIPNTEITFPVTVKPLMDDNGDGGLAPKYAMSDFTYQWDKADFWTDDGEIIIEGWEPVAKGKNYKAKVLSEDSEELYRCGVTAEVSYENGKKQSVTRYATYYVCKLSYDRWFFVASEPYYYVSGDTLQLSVDASNMPDEEVSGYTVERDQITYQWAKWQYDKAKDEWDWINIQGKTGKTLSAKADGSTYGCKITIPVTKNGQTRTVSTIVEEDCTYNLPVYASVLKKDGEGFSSDNELRQEPYGTVCSYKAVLVDDEDNEVDGSYAPDPVSQLKIDGYKWQIYDRDRDAYVDLPGETKEQFDLSVQKYGEYRCAVSASFKLYGVPKKAEIYSDSFRVTVRTDLSVQVIVKDAAGKTAGPGTKGQVTLIASVSGKDSAPCSCEWWYSDRNTSSDKKLGTGFSVNVNVPAKATSYWCDITDGYGYTRSYPEDWTLSLPIKPDEGRTAIFKEISKSLTLGKNKITIPSDDYSDGFDNTGNLYRFQPGEDGFYRIYSAQDTFPVGPNAGEDAVDPRFEVRDSYGNMIGEDDDLDYVGEPKPGDYNFDRTLYLEGGRSYYFLLGRKDESYIVNIEKVKASHIHVFDQGKVTKQAAQGQEGVKTYTCYLCGETKTEKIPALESKKEQKILPKSIGTAIEVPGLGTVQVTSADEKEPTVKLMALTDKKAKKVTVPDTVTSEGVTYKITGISAKVFKGSKTVQEVTFGEQIVSVDPKSFAGCKKLKKITFKGNRFKLGNNVFAGCKSLRQLIFKSANLTKKNFSKKTFKGLGKKVTVKVPKKKLKKLKALLRSMGLPKNVKVKKG